MDDQVRLLLVSEVTATRYRDRVGKVRETSYVNVEKRKQLLVIYLLGRKCGLPHPAASLPGIVISNR